MQLLPSKPPLLLVMEREVPEDLLAVGDVHFLLMNYLVHCSALIL